ncbi:YbhN family protein [Streptomyces sp. NPDC094437]|uniref:lysylphosphatidylglycerol synthase transmembrane domain-containing protein n=1 Tax=Streptomyces sp. NPDC094437 TaxID=3366060 RepID=UPI0037F51AF7
MTLLPLDETPAPLPSVAAPTAPPSAPDPAPPLDAAALPPLPHRFFRPPGSVPGAAAPARLVRRLLVLLPLLLIVVWATFDWRTVYDGTVRLGSADPWWLLGAFGFTCLGWLSSSCVRQGALPERLPTGLLIASQFAAGAANHVLPASLGAHAVTLRFLLGRGIPLARATASLALYSLVRPVAKTLVLLVFLVTSPDLLRLGDLAPDARTLTLAAGGATAALTVAGVVVTAVRPLRRPLLNALRTALTDVRVLHTRTSRIVLLWGGAAAAPLLQASVIYAVGAALGLTLSWAQVAFAFLAASTAVGAVPAPGGIGPIDAATVFALASMGAPLDLAATAVIGYRVLTVWLPLLPGALALSTLVQRKVL